MATTKKMLAHEYLLMEQCIAPIGGFMNSLSDQYRAASDAHNPVTQYTFTNEYTEIQRAIGFCQVLKNVAKKHTSISVVDPKILTHKEFTSQEQDQIQQCLRGIHTEFMDWFNDIEQKTNLQVNDYFDASNKQCKEVRTPTTRIKEILDATSECTQIKFHD